MAETVISNLDEYIEKIERGITFQKSKGKSYWMDFLIRFSYPSMASELTNYFENKGYKIEVKDCLKCKTWDVEIQW